LRSFQEIQPDFEEAKAQTGLWSQGKKEEEEEVTFSVFHVVMKVVSRLDLNCRNQ
jgi:hypothetical protein